MCLMHVIDDEIIEINNREANQSTDNPSFVEN